MDFNDTEMNKEPQEEKKKGLSNVFEWIEEIIFAAIVISVIFTFFFRIITVDGRSMMNTYNHGDRVLVTNLTGTDYKRGDVVIVANALEEPIIKRVIAKENEVVDFDPVLKEVTVNGIPIDGPTFGVDPGITEVPDYPGQVLSFPQTVPEGCVFVLGDNRTNSTDSRFTSVGMVDCRNILGKVVLNLFPFDKFGFVSSAS